LNPKSAEHCAIRHFTAFHYFAFRPSGTNSSMIRVTFGEPNGEPRRAEACEPVRTPANGKSSVRAQFRTTANVCERPKPTPQASGSARADPCERIRTPANYLCTRSFRVRLAFQLSVRDEGGSPLYSTQHRWARVRHPCNRTLVIPLGIVRTVVASLP
jgi:hypothetical protein